MVSAGLVILVAAIALGLLAGLAGAGIVLARARRVDLPDERRLHTAPTPRGGGVGIPLASLLALPLVWDAPERRTVLLVLGWALANAVMGFVDDHHPLRSRVKFALQAAAAIAVVSLGLRLDVLEVPPLPALPLGVVAYPFSVLWLIWMANVFNFMDGMDALASVSGVIFFAALGALGSPALAALAASTGGGLVGFLRYNRPPARIFMGDSGALHTGALLGGLVIALAPRVPFAASALILGPFLWDATYTIVRRFLRGDPMLPHRTHLFQRLALAGWSHGRVRALYFGLALVAAAGGLALPRLGSVGQGAVLGVAALLGIALVGLTLRAEARAAPR